MRSKSISVCRVVLVVVIKGNVVVVVVMMGQMMGTWLYLACISKTTHLGGGHVLLKIQGGGVALGGGVCSFPTAPSLLVNEWPCAFPQH